MISQRSFYLWSAWLPLLIPAILLALDLTYEVVSIPAPYGSGATVETYSQIASRFGITESGLGFFFLLPFYYGGAQYFIFLLFMLLRYRHKGADFFGKLSFKMPLMYLPFCMLGLLGYSIYKASEMSNMVIAASVSSALFIGLFALPFGYAYVSLVHLARYTLLKVKILTP